MAVLTQRLEVVHVIRAAVGLGSDVVDCVRWRCDALPAALLTQTVVSGQHLAPGAFPPRAVASGMPVASVLALCLVGLALGAG